MAKFDASSNNLEMLNPSAQLEIVMSELLLFSAKSVDSLSPSLSQRYVEFYDTRVSYVLCNRRKADLIVDQSAEEAFDRLRHQGLQDGVMDIVLAWEESAGPPIRCVELPNPS